MSLPITVRQTKNPLVTDVQYIASKLITLPDPRQGPRSATLFSLGFGKPNQKFRAVSSTGSTQINHGPRRPTLPLAAVREILWYDEKLGGPTLTVIDVKDLEAVIKWNKDYGKEGRRGSGLLF